MELIEVASDVFAALQEDRGWGWNNAGFLSSGDGLMVDTFIDVKHTRQALSLYSEKSSRRPAQLVNTHHNIDHCWGNQLFKDDEIIAHRGCAERMAKDFTPAALMALMNDPNASPGVAWFSGDLRDFDFGEVEPRSTWVESRRKFYTSGRLTPKETSSYTSQKRAWFSPET